MSTTSDAILFEILEELRGLREDLKSPQTGANPPESDVIPEEVAEVHSGDRRVQDDVERYMTIKALEVSPQHLQIIRCTLNSFVDIYPIDRSGVTLYRDDLIDNGKAPKTINNNLTIIGGFCQHMTGINPTKGLKIKMKEAAQDQRKAFTNFEVHEVLHDLVECARESSDARYWLPIMMAYTGARPEELAQLRVKDVRTVYEGDDTGYLVFDLRGETDGQRIKTESSRRLVPVAQKLMDWGLHRLYSGRDGDEMLFPALNAGVSGRFAEAPSRWFNARLRREGIVDSKLTLYSFRHSVATELKRQGIGDTTISEILGHSVSGQTSRYAKHFELETLADALAQLDWCL